MLATPDDRAVFAALLNHLPATMEATRLILSATAEVGVQPGPGLEQKVVELIRQTVALNLAVITLEDRFERLEGRPGLPEGTWAALMTEFVDEDTGGGGGE